MKIINSHLNFFQDFDFSDSYQKALHSAEQWSKIQNKIPKQMRSFEESAKSKKTVASMIEKKEVKEKVPGKHTFFFFVSLFL